MFLLLKIFYRKKLLNNEGGLFYPGLKKSHYNPSINFFHKQHARAGPICLLGGVNLVQRRTNKPLSIGDCCQGDVAPIMGQCVMCKRDALHAWTTYALFVKEISAGL